MAQDSGGKRTPDQALALDMLKMASEHAEMAGLLRDLADYDTLKRAERCTPEYLERMAIEARAILARIEGE